MTQLGSDYAADQSKIATRTTVLREAGIRVAPLVIAAAITALAWPIAAGPARGTVESSWQVALHLAAMLNLQHGIEFVWTYGPLGFLGFQQPYLGATSSLAFVASCGIYLAVIGTMLVEARRLLPVGLAVIVTLLAARTLAVLPPFEAFQALVAILCIEALAGRIPFRSAAIAAVLGVLTAVAVLGKINVGIFVSLMAAITVASISRPPWRGLLTQLAVAVATGLVIWVASGQQLTTIGPYVTQAYQIVSGYNDAMTTEVDPNRAWVDLAFVVTTVILLWSGWVTSRDWPSRRRVGLAAVGVVLGFAMWKTLIVREHGEYVFATCLIVLFALGSRIDRRTWLASAAAIGIAVLAASEVTPAGYADVVGSVRSFAGEAADALVPARSSRAVDRTLDQLRKSYAIQPEILAAVGAGSVHIDPYFTSVAAAYPELRWTPLPVFQSYLAYTPELDGLNAAVLRSDAAPDRILRSFRAAPVSDLLQRWIGRPLRAGEVLPAMVDGRFRWFEAPVSTLETFCRYSEIAVSETWQVLARSANTCGTPEPITTVTARAGDSVQVPTDPRADRFTIVRIHGLAPSFLGTIGQALTTAPTWYIVVDDTRYRLIPGTASEGLLVAVPDGADGTGRFAFGPPIRTLTVKQGQTGRGSRQSLTFEFLSVPWLRAP